MYNKKYYQSNRKKVLRLNKLWRERNKTWVNNYYAKHYREHAYGGAKNKMKEIGISQCEKCGMTETESINVYKTSLHIHHIDRDRRNNDLNNLNLLCISCHISGHHEPEIKIEDYINMF